MPKSRLSKSAPARLAAVSRAGDGPDSPWRLVVLRAKPEREVESAYSFAAADITGLKQAITRAKADVVVAVAPAHQTVARVVAAPMPTGTAEQVAGAMGLIAEAQSANTPAHRRAAGRVEIGPAGALVAVTWSGGLDGHPLMGPKQAEPLWAPEPVALAALASAARASVAVLADRVTGAIVALAGSAERAAARVLCDDGDDPAAWSAAVNQRLAAACAAAGVSAPRLDGLDAPRTLALMNDSGPATPAVAGVRAERGWLAEFGTALGAALAAADATPASAGLLGMWHDEPVPAKPLLLHAVDAVAKPRRAIPILAACAAILLLWPLGVAWARYHYLLREAEVVRADRAELNTARKQAEFYQLLRERRWPMTKLLSDLTGGLPSGITLESVTIETGQRIRVAGVSDNAAAVSDWRAALDRTRVFDEIRTPDQQASRFELTARVVQPLLLPGGTPEPLPARTQAAAAEPVTSDQPAAATPREQAREPRTDAKGEVQKTAVLPEPLTDDQINAMDLATSTREWGLRRGASLRPGVSAEDKQRLTDEAEKLQRHRRALQSSGGGGG